tara:strand:- start:208 stop:411 length:204 start_codon:yes stop_codon:yes gene_type:complete
MKIYICHDQGDEKTWIIKSKDIKSFLKEKEYIDSSYVGEYKVNNLHQICMAVEGGSGMYTSEVYKPV